MSEIEKERVAVFVKQVIDNLPDSVARVLTKDQPSGDALYGRKPNGEGDFNHGVAVYFVPARLCPAFNGLLNIMFGKPESIKQDFLDPKNPTPKPEKPADEGDQQPAG